MFRLVLFLVFIILRAEANIPEIENPVIRLPYAHNNNENYVVWKDKPLKIILENGPTRYVRCNSKYRTVDNGIFVQETDSKHGNIQIINITHVTAAMSTTWTCLVLEELRGPLPYKYKNPVYTPTEYFFNLHVKGARAVTVIANNQSLTYVTTNLSVNFDGETDYTYGDGEDFPMEFSCEKAEDNHIQDTLRLEYYNAEGILLFQTMPQKTRPHTFRSVLKSNNDKYYLDCIRTSRGPEREYRYRTTFFKKYSHADAVHHAVILSVNGQTLSTFFNKTKSYVDYIFRYIDGEVLNVTCRKLDGLAGLVSLNIDEIINKQVLTSDNSSEAVVSLNIATLDIDRKYLTCSINNTVVENPNARILFWCDVPIYELRIRGLPRHNILYQYTNDLNEWTIEYQYSVNDILNLTCVWNDGDSPSPYKNQFLWKFENEMFSSAAIEMPSTLTHIQHKRFSDISFMKILEATHNGSKIQCVYGSYPFNLHKTVEIILRLKANLVSEENEIVSGESSTNGYTLVYCLTAAGVIVIIILMISYWTVKKSCCYIRSSSQELPPIPMTCPNPDSFS